MDHDTTPRKKLTDILNGGGDSLRSAWDSAQAASDFAALPADIYRARIIGGELVKAKGGTPGYKLTFKVIEGEHANRHFWHDVWLTPAALPMAKRDLGKLGITSLEQLEAPLPAGIRCKVKLALRRDDDGTEYNKVRTFEVLGIDGMDDAAFAPPPVEPTSPHSGTPESQATMFAPAAPQMRSAQAEGL